MDKDFGAWLSRERFTKAQYKLFTDGTTSHKSHFLAYEFASNFQTSCCDVTGKAVNKGRYKLWD